MTKVTRPKMNIGRATLRSELLSSGQTRFDGQGHGDCSTIDHGKRSGLSTDLVYHGLLARSHDVGATDGRQFNQILIQVPSARP